MSAFGAALGRAVGALGGPQIATLIIVSGLLVGAGTGGFIAAGGPGQGGSSSGELDIYPCPGVGPVLQTVPAGQRFLVTGRTADGSWARIHYPQPGRTEAWVQVSPLTFKASLDSVPVATCGAELAVAAPSIQPGASLTPTQNNSPSPAPTPVPTTTPTPNSGPSLTKLTASTSKISYDQASYCPKAVKRVTFTVKGGGDTGLVAVTLFWRAPGAGSYAEAAMSRSGGTATSGTWQVTLDTTANGITQAGSLAFYAVGKDASGASDRIPNRGSDAITVAVCSNTGPAIKSASSSARQPLRWDPLGVGGCTTRTTISAAVTDVDGVKSVTLFYRRPGDSTWSSKPMTKSGGKWSARLDTAADKITIPSPPTGNLRWYIKAVDGKDASSQTKAASITIRRCDTEATFGRTTSTAPSPYPNQMCPRWATTFYGSASDPDGISGSSAEFVYTYVLKDGTKKTATAKMSGTFDGNWYYHVTIQPTSNWSFSAVMTYYIRTTDVYGGVSKGGSGKIVQGC